MLAKNAFYKRALQVLRSMIELTTMQVYFALHEDQLASSGGWRAPRTKSPGKAGQSRKAPGF